MLLLVLCPVVCRGEGWGLPVVEAMSMELPVIVVSSGPNRVEPGRLAVGASQHFTEPTRDPHTWSLPADKF